MCGVRVSDVRPGTKLIGDGLCCTTANVPMEVRKEGGRLYVLCEDGRHWLVPQDGRYVGFRLA